VADVADVQIVIVDGPNAGREFELSGATVVGRDQSAGLVIDDPEASRRHASLSVDGETVTVEDLGSTNGTFVNGARISGSKQLAGGDKVRIGTTVFELRLPQAEEPDVSDQATRMGTALPDLDELQVTAPRQVPDFAKEPEPPAAEPEPPTPEPVAPEPVQPTAAGIPQPPAPTNAPPPSAGAPGGAGGPPGGAAGPPPPPGGPPPPAAGPPPSAPPPPAPAPPPPPAAAPPPPVGAPAGAYSPAPYGGGATSTSDYPINVEADYPQNGITNWRPLVHWLMAIPHFIALFFVFIAAYFAFIGVWFSILFTRRYPPGLFNFLTGAMRWGNRVSGYYYWMTEEYPPFSLDEAPYPIRSRFTYPEAGISRWRAFFQGFLAIPHFIVLYFLGIGAYVGAVIAFFAILFTGQYPPAVFNFMVGVMRWQTRTFGFVLLMTEEYPPFSLE
jgi:pSer/pThr/pTyr-binding forkhead associated (FHA) protein